MTTAALIPDPVPAIASAAADTGADISADMDADISTDIDIGGDIGGDISSTGSADPAVDISAIRNFLLCATPQAWIDAALLQLDMILVDHAANEMKAAQSAMTLMAKNPHKVDLLNKMSRLAREELVHFEQVLKILKKRGIQYYAIKASTYAATMARHMRSGQQEKLMDTLIVGAIIEARSCERFASLAPYLDRELQKFYISLLKSESRHFQDYLTLAGRYGDVPLEPRVQFFLELEQEAILSPDPLFRFHSGLPL